MAQTSAGASDSCTLALLMASEQLPRQAEIGETMTVVVRASGRLPGQSEETCQGELYVGDAAEIPELTEDDWCVTARTFVELRDGLRALL
jgi:hypothetical protein